MFYHRLHVKSEYEGSGIGLAHCKKIIDLHKGEIWVDSELGKGSYFLFHNSQRTVNYLHQIYLSDSI